jgi:methanogenic corrinoid protein MtbC1
MKASVEDFEQALLRMDRISVKRFIDELIGRISSVEIIEDVITKALERIGEGWAQGALSLSQVYMSGRICEELVDTLLPPGGTQHKNQPKMAITVLEDYHLLGKRIVYSMIRSAGFDIMDYGRTDVPGLLDRLRQDRVEILLVSVLMLPSALRIKEVVSQTIDENLGTHVIVGGAPFLFDDNLWREVGAEAMGRTGSDAVQLLQQITGAKP